MTVRHLTRVAIRGFEARCPYCGQPVVQSLNEVLAHDAVCVHLRLSRYEVCRRMAAFQRSRAFERSLA